MLKAFRVDLKAFLGLVLPNEYCLIAMWEIEAGFWVILFRGPRLLLCGPYYTVLYDVTNETEWLRNRVISFFFFNFMIAIVTVEITSKMVTKYKIKSTTTITVPLQLLLLLKGIVIIRPL